MLSALLDGLDVKVIVAIIGLAGTLIAALIAYRQWRTGERFKREAGFVELEHYYRPAGLPREQQPWLASVWRKSQVPER